MTDPIASALADALSTPRWCLNCGHDERVPITAPAHACCPEPEYKSVQEMMLMVIRARQQVKALREELSANRARDAEFMAVAAEMEKYKRKAEEAAAKRPPRRPDWSDKEWALDRRKWEV